MSKKRDYCCKYQEEIKKLTRKKIRKKQSDVDDECEEDGEKIQGNMKKSGGIRRKYVSEPSGVIDRIKPAVNVRNEYLDSRHARCIMDDSGGHGNSPFDSTKKFRREKKTINPRNSMRMQEHKINGSNKSGDFARFMSKKRKNFQWTKELSTDSDTSSECDEICSFDSDVNLSGVTLSPEDQQKIVENRIRTHPSLLNNTDTNASKLDVN